MIPEPGMSALKSLKNSCGIEAIIFDSCLTASHLKIYKIITYIPTLRLMTFLSFLFTYHG